MSKVVIPMKLLNRLYTEEKLSTWEIAKKIGVQSGYGSASFACLSDSGTVTAQKTA